MPYQVPTHDWRIDEVLDGGRADVAHHAARQVFRRHPDRVELLLYRVDNQHDPGHRVHEGVEFVVPPMKKYSAYGQIGLMKFL